MLIQYVSLLLVVPPPAGACNYDALATLSNGTCDYSCVGCSDPLALNYSGPSFTIDDGSCLYCNLSGASFVVDAFC